MTLHLFTLSTGVAMLSAVFRFILLFSFFFGPVAFVEGSEVPVQELKENSELSPRQNCREERHAIARMNCFAELADQGNDVTFCNSASPESLKYKCYAIYARRKLRPGICREIPAGEVRDECLSGLSEKSGDQKLCEEIRTSRYKDSCYAGVVRKTGKVELCGKIGDRIQQRICSGGFGQ